jgi:hypothetical protein
MGPTLMIITKLASYADGLSTNVETFPKATQHFLAVDTQG